ncbi:MAG: DNA sulfur modification protein DndB [Planctomycetaceae bacterium]
MSAIEFNIPVVQGRQGRRPFYTGMFPVKFLPKLFPIGANPSVAEAHQSFRSVNLTRVREIAKEIVAHQDNFNLAAVTISIEQAVRFVAPARLASKLLTTGELYIPLDAKMTIIDGIHRIYGLQLALKELRDLGDECLAVVIYVDPDGVRRGQIFSDVKRYERSSAQSLRIGLDDRDETAKLTRDMISHVPVFANSIEMEKTAISNRSRNLFTLSALYHANQLLLADLKYVPYADRLKIAVEFWVAVSEQIPDWSEIVNGPKSAAEIRATYVHCHAIGIAALARAGRALLAEPPKRWKKRILKLRTLDWSRTNTQLWEGRAMIGGRLSKSNSAVARAGNAVKLHLGIELSRDESAMET